MQKRNGLLVVWFIVFCFFQISRAQQSINPQRFARTSSGDVKAWIFFKDKGDNQQALFKPAELLSERAIYRRLLRRPGKPLIDESDLPLFEPYIEQLRPLVTRIRVKSCWLNAISAEVMPENLPEIRKMDFVLKIQPVGVGKRIDPPVDLREEEMKIFKKTFEGDSLPYGNSYDQLELIKVPYLHKLGLHGEDVVIAMLDDGFNLLNYHIAFDSLNVLDTFDFIHGDSDVTDSEFKAYEGWHGTKTLSVIAGYMPDWLIGPAFKASFLLAKTEVDQSETPIEEDYWVAGIEWAEAKGADIVSSSLGYIDWYTPQDMDGETAVTTIAADKAVEKGVLVFNSAGNEGDNPSANTLIAPADGKKVLAIAATDKFGLRAWFSSVGPTADGRIKPDLAAMGLGVYTASSYDPNVFNYANGTSFSCPLAAGGAALLLQAFPETSPELMSEALRNTASQANFPDKFLGWGIINLEKAYAYLDSATYAKPLKNEHLMVYQNRPNPASTYTTFVYQLKYPSAVEVRVFDVLGQRVTSLGTKYRVANQLQFEKFSTSNLASGTYFCLVLARELGTGIIYRKAIKFVVLH